ncbi:histamine H3 receptor-like [Strongylocentrotus purpuratus]|uniref:G-protein coupled receptors family 1 profile domain-containing protein n=1 Tax=Strongylocentrotus purpuratus TaxID=7668 RepID=A0A7M7P1T1_STRPU|nr:histamine H3 receptor-like [Strongylocentrotus purpuratus]
MVILAYVRDRRIRANVASLFILNLAITDLVVGTFMWPITLEWLIKDDWVHGEIFCKVWLIVDYTMTMVSALTLVMISWDRYCLLTMEMRYSTFQTKKRIALIILNIAVYRNIRQRSKGIVGQSPQDFPLTKSTARSLEDTDNSQDPGPSCPPGEGAVKEQATRGASSLPAVETVEEYNRPQPDGNLPSGSEVPKQKKTDRQIFARHRKAAVVLGLLVGFFLICWVPIQVTSVMFAICGHNCVSYLNWEVTNALVWSNSMINPFIYAATNIHFRRNFRHFLLLDRWAWKVTPK